MDELKRDIENADQVDSSTSDTDNSSLTDLEVRIHAIVIGDNTINLQHHHLKRVMRSSQETTSRHYLKVPAGHYLFSNSGQFVLDPVQFRERPLLTPQEAGRIILKNLTGLEYDLNWAEKHLRRPLA